MRRVVRWTECDSQSCSQVLLKWIVECRSLSGKGSLEIPFGVAEDFGTCVRRRQVCVVGCTACEPAQSVARPTSAGVHWGAKEVHFPRKLMFDFGFISRECYVEVTA